MSIFDIIEISAEQIKDAWNSAWDKQQAVIDERDRRIAVLEEVARLEYMRGYEAGRKSAINEMAEQEPVAWVPDNPPDGFVYSCKKTDYHCKPLITRPQKIGE